MRKLLLSLSLLTLSVMPAAAIIWHYDELDMNKQTCRLSGWSGSQPASGKLKLPASWTDDNKLKYTVTSVAPGALDHLTTVTQIEIPESITSMGNAVTETDQMNMGLSNFNDCPALEKFIVAAGNTRFAATGAGILVSKNGKTLYKVPQAISVTDYKLPMSSSVEVIAPGALSGNSTIRTLALSKSLREIDAAAGFHQMSSLREITISGNQLYHTTDGVLYATSSKTLLAYPVAKTATTFAVPAGVTAIGDFAFANNRTLSSVTLPSSLKKMGISAFSKARKLSSAKIPASVTSIGDSAFINCNALTSIALGSAVELPRHFAYNCKSLAKVTGTVKAPVKINGRAFAHCTSLKEFPFSGATEIAGDSVFADCGFSEVIFNNDAIAKNSGMGFYTFADCKSLTRLDMSAVNCSDPALSYHFSPALANGCSRLTVVCLPLRSSFSSTTGHKPTFGENSSITRFVTGSFTTVGSGVIGYLGGSTRAPWVYTAVRGRLNAPSVAYTPYGNLFKSMGGARISPSICTDLYEPYGGESGQGGYACPGATYYIPALTTDNYKKASEAGCTLNEMFDLTFHRIDGALAVKCRSLMAPVVITGIAANGGTPAAPDADGIASTGIDFRSAESVEVYYTVSGIEMMTVYPADIIQESGVSEISDDYSEAAPRYFNLQGIETAAPVPGNVYIVVRGHNVTKELCR